MVINYYKYHLPFADSLQTSKITFETRDGIIIECVTDQFQCYGDVAPLPGYSKETLDDVQKVLSNKKDTLESKLSTTTNNIVDCLQDFYKEEDIPNTLQFGLDSVAYQIQAFNSGKNLREHLFSAAPDKIPVNAIVSLQSEDYAADIQKHISEGFQTIKFKIGINFELEFNRLQKIRADFPDLIIRLDANQAWTIETASRNCQKLESLNIEYCEEPLNKPTPGNFEILNSNTQLPLALDDSLYQVSYWPNLLPYTSYLIIKPMFLGSFTKIFETKRFADTHNNKAIFTTSLESGIGRRVTAVLASGKGSPQIAHGLTTGKLLAKDIHNDTTCISDGFYYLDRLPSKEPYKLQNVSKKIF